MKPSTTHASQTVPVDDDLADAAADVRGKTELDAVVAYLQALGTHAPKGE